MLFKIYIVTVMIVFLFVLMNGFFSVIREQFNAKTLTNATAIRMSLIYGLMVLLSVPTWYSAIRWIWR